MAGFIYSKPGLILPGSPEWNNPHLCDFLGFSDFFMAGSPVDPYRGYVRLLIQPKVGDSTVIDYAPTPKNVTVNGGSVMGGTSPWSGYQGLALDGTKYLTLADSPDWTLSGDCTIEVVWTTTAGTNGIVFSDGWIPGATYQSYSMTSTASDTVNVLIYKDGGGAEIVNVAPSAVRGNTHAAVMQREGNVYSVYIDGTRTHQVTSTSSPFDNTGLFSIGAAADGQGKLTGTIAALRVTGAARNVGSPATIPNAVHAGPFIT